MPDTLHVLAPLRVEATAARRGARRGARVDRTGMGPDRSRRAVAAIAPGLPPSQPVAVVGLCGALSPGLRPGDVVVASSLASSLGDAQVALPGAELVASRLAAEGLAVHVGPIVSSDRVTTGDERSRLAASGALAVDMESAWLAAGLRGREPDRPIVVVRVVLDAPGHELRSLHTPRRLLLARRRLATVIPVLERWAAVTGPRTLVLAAPRSFCAGVERAIEIVERAIDQFGAPVYVRRQIVHNSHVVRDLEFRGAVFVQELGEVPPGATVVLAAHGVSPEVRREAAGRQLRVIDATCPLVGKVHAEARRFAERDYHIVLIGHHDHEEVEGTVGEAPGRIDVVASPADVDALDVRDPERVAYLTQTTLAVDETRAIVAHLQGRFPAVVGPRSEDICYATQNRQEAVAAIAPEADVVLVVGSANSSNSRRLAEVAERAGCRSYLVDGVADIDLAWLDGAATIGITAGASAPESKVQEVVAAIGSLGHHTVDERAALHEDVTFALPAELR